MKKLLFNWGFKRKLFFMQEGRPSGEAAPLFDKLIFSKVGLMRRIPPVLSDRAPRCTGRHTGMEARAVLTGPARAGVHSASHAHPFAGPSQIKARLGGCVRVIISGGAPLAPHVEEFLRVAMCVPVAQVGLVSGPRNLEP